MSHPEALAPARLVATRLVQLRRDRSLPGPGTVHVAVGEEVEPGTLVAEGTRPGAVRVVEAGALLGLPRHRLEEALLVRPGDTVTAGQPLASRKRGLRRRVVRSPLDGEVLAVGPDGSILLGGARDSVQIFAGMRGRVIGVTETGALIEGSGALFQGIWGNGAEALGPLRLLTRDREKALEAGQFDERGRGSIVAGGGAVTRDGLEAAQAVGVQGLIAGSMPYDLVGIARALPFPVMLTEGFGRIPMAAPIFEGITLYDGHAAMLDARFSPASAPARPDVFVPLDQPAQPLPGRTPLVEGQLVRVAAEPATGKVGRIVTLEAGPRRTESGLMLAGCEVELESGETVFVPYSNLEQLVQTEAVEA